MPRFGLDISNSAYIVKLFVIHGKAATLPLTNFSYDFGQKRSLSDQTQLKSQLL